MRCKVEWDVCGKVASRITQDVGALLREWLVEPLHTRLGNSRCKGPGVTEKSGLGGSVTVWLPHRVSVLQVQRAD